MRQSPKYSKTKVLPKKVDNNRKRGKAEDMQVTREFDSATRITKEYVRQISTAQYKNAVISLYLSFGPDKTIRDPKNYLSTFNSLKAQELKRNKYANSLNHNQQKTLKEDLEDISVLLEEKLVIEGFRSLVIFKAGDELKLMAKLPLRLEKDLLVIDSNPYTSPLAILLQEQKRVMVVKLTRNQTVFCMFEMGSCEEIHQITVQALPDPDVEKSRPEKMQAHQLDHLNHHFKECGDYIYKQSSAQAFDYVIVVGHEEITTKKFINTLHPEVKERLLDSVSISPHELENEDATNSVIDAALENYQLNRESLYESELSQAKGQGSITDGLEQVLAAHNRGLLRELYVQGNFEEKGYICPTRHFISLQDGAPCPLCQKELHPVKNCIDELIEIANSSGVSVHLFTKRPEIMIAYQKIAAITY